MGWERCELGDPAVARRGYEGVESVEAEACGHGFWDWRCLLEWVLAGAALRQAQGKASAASSCCCSSPCEGRGRLGGGAHGSSRSQKHPSPTLPCLRRGGSKGSRQAAPTMTWRKHLVAIASHRARPVGVRNRLSTASTSPLPPNPPRPSRSTRATPARAWPPSGDRKSVV